MNGSARMGLHRRLRKAEVAAALSATPVGGGPVTDTELSALPPPVRRYLRFMGVVGRPRDRAFRGRFRWRFRLRPGQRWMPFDAWRYNSAAPIARIFEMRIAWAGAVAMFGRDTYLDGRRVMRGKLLSLFMVASGEGPQFDVGELATWLNDAVLVSPSMLLDPAVSWTAVDDRAFEATVSDAGLTVCAQVIPDERGAPVDFATTDRYAALQGGPLQARWTTPVKAWQVAGGRPQPTGGSAVWDLPEGPFTYVEGGFVPGSLAYDVAPGGP